MTASLLSAAEAPPPLRPRAAADAVWGSAPVLFAVLGADLRLRGANPAWRSLLGLEPGRLDGRRLSEFVHPDDLSELLAGVGGTVPPREFVLRMRQEGACNWHPVAWLGARDGAEIVLVGRAAASADVELDRAALQQAQRLQAISRLCGGMSHEFNNLLQSLRNALELIRRRPAEHARVRGLAEGALRIVAGGSRMTAQLLDFAGVQRGPQRPVRVADLTALREPLQRRLGPAIGLSFEGLHDAGWVMADPHRLQVALLNMAINAGESMPAGGRLMLRCERVNLERDAELASGAYLKFSVCDEGPGMSDAVRERAFEPFFTTKPIGAGPGLGLAQVYGFAHYSGGSVRIDPDRGLHGTTVNLLLPAIMAPEPIQQDSVRGDPGF